jgi:hypothetical protein
MAMPPLSVVMEFSRDNYDFPVAQNEMIGAQAATNAVSVLVSVLVSVGSAVGRIRLRACARRYRRKLR